MKFVVCISEDEKNYAYCIKATESDNLICKLKIKNITSINIFQTHKKAAEIATLWNDCYKANGTYLYDETFYANCI